SVAPDFSDSFHHRATLGSVEIKKRITHIHYETPVAASHIEARNEMPRFGDRRKYQRLHCTRNSPRRNSCEKVLSEHLGINQLRGAYTGVWDSKLVAERDAVEEDTHISGCESVAIDNDSWVDLDETAVFALFVRLN